MPAAFLEIHVLDRLILIALLLISACAAPASDPQPAARESDSEWGEEIAPWDIREHRLYEEFVRRVLLGDEDPFDWPEYWMVCRPSFATEYAVQLTPPLSVGEARQVPKDAPWTLTVANASIWIASRNPDIAEPDWSSLTPADVDVHRVEVAVAADDARQLAAAWRAIVRRARNPAPEYVVVDGEREERSWAGYDGNFYEFRGNEFYGETWSPEPGPAADLVALVEQLAAAAAADSASRAEILHACVASARALQVRAEALPW